MIPHDYQAQAVDVTVSSLQAYRQALVIMATGLGKTLVAALVNRELRQDRKRFRNLVVCHDTDILEQSEPTFRGVLGDSVEIGYFNGETKEGADAEIVFSTFQTLREWKDAFFPDEFDLVTIDEAHHSQAMTYKDVIEYFSGARLGLTAMRDRMDGKDIAEIFGEPVVSIPLEEAMIGGLLTPFEYRVVSDGLNTEVVRALTREIESGKRFTLSDVNKRLFIETRDDEIVRRIKHEADSRKTLVFCRNIRHADRIAEMLGPLARSYHSDATRAVNRDTLNAFRAGVIQFLVTVNKANEGVDIPDAEVVAFLRTTDSKTVFFEQLGRSLRKLPGKKKSLILDFVGNVERIVMLQDVVRKIGQNLGLFENEERELVSVSGIGFEFNFSETIVEVLDLVTRLRRGFYPTWQEAGAAAASLGITSSSMYLKGKRYREDLRLPASPAETYDDFPSWPTFLGVGKKSFYPTWQEAGAAARKMGITTRVEYKERYKQDPRLPSDPWITYKKDFSGWSAFIGLQSPPKGIYPSWKEATIAVERLGIKNWKDYLRRYRLDPLLPSNPRTVYEDFPGWAAIRKWDRFYLTWEEASVAAIRLGITTLTEYMEKKLHRRDPKLPANPHDKYVDFPGWPVFLSRQKLEHYATWAEAAAAARTLGIKSSVDWRKPELRRDPRLPPYPDVYEDFPGWEFFSTNPRPTNNYPTWQEASTAARKLRFKSGQEYRRRYREDPRLPSTPRSSYKDFPGWKAFLGTEPKKKFYPTWEEAADVIRSLGIKGHYNYMQRYKEDPRLPSNLTRTYKEFPGWLPFLRGRKRRTKG